MTMYNATEQFAEINKAGYDNAVKLASLSLDKAEQPGQAQPPGAPRSSLEQGVYYRQRGRRHQGRPGTRHAVRAKLTEAGVQNALGYSRGVYQIASGSASRFLGAGRSRRGPRTPGLGGVGRKATKNAPAGSDVAVTALKSTVAATTAAFDQFSKATKQVVSFADASVRAAAANAANATKPADQGPQGRVRQSDNASPLGA